MKNDKAFYIMFVLANQKKYGKHPAVKFADTNVGGGEGFITLPLYAIGLIELNNEQSIVVTAVLSKLKVPTDNS